MIHIINEGVLKCRKFNRTFCETILYNIRIQMYSRLNSVIDTKNEIFTIVTKYFMKSITERFPLYTGII